jgi:hypothetical protein
MIDKSRRHFFNDLAKNSVQLLAKAYQTFQADNPDPDADYFSSYESAYTLISENLPFIEEEVVRLGIDVEGKSQLDIVKEIYERSHIEK